MKTAIEIFDLIPQNGRKSFYGKAKVIISGDNETLLSYNSEIVSRNRKTGKLKRLYFDDPSNTTCTHIFSFCGLRKKEFLKLA